MNSSLLDIAAGVRAAQSGGAGNYAKQGKGVAIIKSLFLGKKFSGQTFIGELLVESSQSYADAEVTPESNGQPEQANAPGSSFSQVCKLDGDEKKKKTAQKNMKNFLYELLGETDASIQKAATDRLARFLKNEEQPPKWLAEIGKTGAEWNADLEWATILDRVTSTDQPCVGMALRYETVRITTNNGAGKRITVVNWYHIPGQTPETIAARRALIAGTPPAAQ